MHSNLKWWFLIQISYEIVWGSHEDRARIFWGFLEDYLGIVILYDILPESQCNGSFDLPQLGTYFNQSKKALICRRSNLLADSAAS